MTIAGAFSKTDIHIVDNMATNGWTAWWQPAASGALSDYFDVVDTLAITKPISYSTTRMEQLSFRLY